MTSRQSELALSAIAALNDVGRGESRTHIHKLLFFAQRWGIVDETFPYSLYLHGPYSYDLDQELLELEAFERVQKFRDPAGYGARYKVDGIEVMEQLKRLAQWLGPKSTRSLEALATAEYVDEADASRCLAAVREVKPHLTEAEVRAAVDEVRQRRREFGRPRP